MWCPWICPWPCMGPAGGADEEALGPDGGGFFCSCNNSDGFFSFTCARRDTKQKHLSLLEGAYEHEKRTKLCISESRELAEASCCLTELYLEAIWRCTTSCGDRMQEQKSNSTYLYSMFWIKSILLRYRWIIGSPNKPMVIITWLHWSEKKHA